MIKNAIALLSAENGIVKYIDEHFEQVDIFDDYIKLIFSVFIRKYNIIILDSPELPYLNAHKIINLLNSICKYCHIIYINRDVDIDSLRNIYNKNSLVCMMDYPIDFTQLNAIIEHLLKKRGNI